MVRKGREWERRNVVGNNEVHGRKGKVGMGKKRRKRHNKRRGEGRR